MYINTEGLVLNDGAHVLNGMAQGGQIGQQFGRFRFDPGLLRPFLDRRGEPCVLLNVGKHRYSVEEGKDVPVPTKIPISYLRYRGVYHPTHNAVMLTKDAWIELDRTIVRTPRLRMRAWTDLVNTNPIGGFNAMSRLTYEYQTMNDVHEAAQDMDGLAAGRADRPLFDLSSIPLPITHADFWYSAREIAVSANGNGRLDTVSGEQSARRVVEFIEKQTVGVEAGLEFGTRSTGPNAHVGSSKIYGFTNFPYRMTKTDLTTPTGSNPEAVMTDMLEMVETMQANGYFGPYIVYHSTPYSRYFSDDYFRTGSTSAVRSLRQRLLEIEGIQDIRRLDFLTTGYQLVMVQMDPEVCGAINGMGLTTLQWEAKGGMQLMFKVMCIMVPLIRRNQSNKTGILHATTS